jgi:hypothetical protein
VEVKEWSPAPVLKVREKKKKGREPFVKGFSLSLSFMLFA